MSCPERCLFEGSRARASLTALNILVRRSAAEARVKVTISIFEMSAGQSGSVMELMILCVRVVVLPDPAAALRRRVLFLVFIAANWASVHFVAISSSSSRLIFSAHRSYGAVFAGVLTRRIRGDTVGNTLVYLASDLHKRGADV